MLYQLLFYTIMSSIAQLYFRIVPRILTAILYRNTHPFYVDFHLIQRSHVLYYNNQYYVILSLVALTIICYGKL